MGGSCDFTFTLPTAPQPEPHLEPPEFRYGLDWTFLLQAQGVKDSGSSQRPCLSGGEDAQAGRAPGPHVSLLARPGSLQTEPQPSNGAWLGAVRRPGTQGLPQPPPRRPGFGHGPACC